MTQPRPGKILSALGLNKARTDLFLGRPYTPKRVLPIKVLHTPPLGDSASSLRFAPPLLKRTRGAALIP
ncbi:hypothetical protein CUMW_101740 [Citrus unshiu]|nr:hypothetical protein CUMW_101740 [Citrus unshiu]